jgi:quercetin dioxygenase-like cupin family protein
MSNFPTPLEEVIHHNVIKNNKTGGPALDIGPMQLLWRALGENTGYTFSIFETTVVPGMGIPLHKHPFAEFFYVLEGTLSIGHWNSQGAAEGDVYEAGESLVVQPNAPHSFFNKSERPCRVLSVSTETSRMPIVQPSSRPVNCPVSSMRAKPRQSGRSINTSRATPIPVFSNEPPASQRESRRHAGKSVESETRQSTVIRAAAIVPVTSTGVGVPSRFHILNVNLPL